MMHVFRGRFRFFLAAAGVCLLTAWGSVAQASLIITPSGTNNSVISLSGGSNRNAVDGLNIGAADSNSVFVGATVVGTTRYVSGAGANRGSSSSNGSAVANIATNYTVQFSIADPGSGVYYDVDIDSLIRGSLTARDDHSGLGGSGFARLTNITSTNSALNVDFGGQVQQGGTSNTSGVQTSVNQLRQTTLVGLSGAQTITLGFSWVTRAESPQNLIGGDIHGARFGLSTPGIGNAAEYPGAPSANINDDGHFVTVTVRVTAVPEPTSAILALTGLAVVVPFRRRRT